MLGWINFSVFVGIEKKLKFSVMVMWIVFNKSICMILVFVVYICIKDVLGGGFKWVMFWLS